MGATIAVRDVTKLFGRGEATTRALDGVTLDVLGGDVLLLLGPSGSGKTVSMPSAAKKETKPCSAAILSSCSTRGSDHVAPPSVLCRVMTSYEYRPPARFCSQCMTTRPDGATKTEGKSAQLTNRSERAVTVDGADH